MRTWNSAISVSSLSCQTRGRSEAFLCGPHEAVSRARSSAGGKGRPWCWPWHLRTSAIDCRTRWRRPARPSSRLRRGPWRSRRKRLPADDLALAETLQTLEGVADAPSKDGEAKADHLEASLQIRRKKLGEQHHSGCRLPVRARASTPTCTLCSVIREAEGFAARGHGPSPRRLDLRAAVARKP